MRFQRQVIGNTLLAIRQVIGIKLVRSNIRTSSIYKVRCWLYVSGQIFWFHRNIVDMCVVKYLNCAVEMLWLVLNDLCAE